MRDRAGGDEEVSLDETRLPHGSNEDHGTRLNYRVSAVARQLNLGSHGKVGVHI